MFWFLLASAAITLAVMLAMLRPMVRGATEAEQTSEPDPAALAESSDTALYRDQLAELERDLERGVVSPAEAEGTRAEIARRLLAAARRAERSTEAQNAPPALTRKALLGAMAGAPMIAIALYFSVGSPGSLDRPLAARDLVAEARAQRLDQADAEQAARLQSGNGPRPQPELTAEAEQYVALVARLQQVVAGRPEDVEGHRLLASALLRLQRFDEAWPVLDRLIALSGGDGAPADLHAAKAEAMILAANGYVSREAEAALAAALRNDPELALARYYAGHALAQIGMLDQAVGLWQRLAREAEPGAPWLPALRAILDDVAPRPDGLPPAGETGIVALPGDVDPDAAAAVASMTPADQMAFMAERAEALEARLIEDGGGAEDWARLIRAYAVLRRMEDARRVYAIAQERLRGSEAGFVREQALVDGVIEE